MTIFFPSVYNKTIIRFGFCDIQNNQGLCKGYQPQPSASAYNPYLDLYYSRYHKKPHPNNCLQLIHGVIIFGSQCRAYETTVVFNLLQRLQFSLLLVLLSGFC